MLFTYTQRAYFTASVAVYKFQVRTISQVKRTVQIELLELVKIDFF